jgi:hypothetical protein
MATLLRHEGAPLSEAMVFGLSAALAFAYIPVIKINELPLIAYRMLPRHILKGVQKRLRLPLRFETFSTPAAGRRRLDELLDQGRVVGLQGSVFFLPYFPASMRFHFNAHNLLVYGREDQDYLVSDPVFDHPTRCPARDLQRARFVRGALAPKGLLYYFDGPLPAVDPTPLLRGAIKSNCRVILYSLLPWLGYRGIAALGRRILKLPAVADPDYTRRFVGHIVRMQEEIGTGGAGFRYLYAAFLQEAGDRLALPALHKLSLELTAIGDEWRDFGVLAARINKGRAEIDLRLLHDTLLSLSKREQAFFRTLLKAV